MRRLIYILPVIFIAILITNSIAVYAVNDYWSVEYRLDSYSTTEYFYPDADVESTSVDGYCGHYVEFGDSWDDILAGVGTTFNDSAEYLFAPYIYADNTNNEWRENKRSIILFDTSSLPDSIDITEAYIEIRGESKVETLSIGGNVKVNVYSSEPEGNTAVLVTDYDSVGAVAFSDSPIAYNAWSVAGYNSFEFNEAGIASVDVEGISKYSLREVYYDVEEHVPEWVSEGYNYIRNYSAEKGEGYKPRLKVVYKEMCLPLAPSNLILIDLGGNTVQATWSMGANATDTIIVVKREKYHTDVGNGELAYSGNGTSTNITGLNLDYVKYCFVLWSKNETGYSENYTSGEIGGEAMQDTVLMVMPVIFGLGLIALNIFLKKPLLYLMVIPCMIAIVLEPAYQNAWIQTSAVGVMIWSVLAFVMRMKEGVEG